MENYTVLFSGPQFFLQNEMFGQGHKTVVNELSLAC